MVNIQLEPSVQAMTQDPDTNNLAPNRLAAAEGRGCRTAHLQYSHFDGAARPIGNIHIDSPVWHEQVLRGRVIYELLHDRKWSNAVKFRMMR